MLGMRVGDHQIQSPSVSFCASSSTLTSKMTSHWLMLSFPALRTMGHEDPSRSPGMEHSQVAGEEAVMGLSLHSSALSNSVHSVPCLGGR